MLCLSSLNLDLKNTPSALQVLKTSDNSPIPGTQKPNEYVSLANYQHDFEVYLKLRILLVYEGSGTTTVAFVEAYVSSPTSDPLLKLKLLTSIS